jgi:hypothetical protein
MQRAGAVTGMHVFGLPGEHSGVKHTRQRDEKFAKASRCIDNLVTVRCKAGDGRLLLLDFVFGAFDLLFDGLRRFDRLEFRGHDKLPAQIEAGALTVSQSPTPGRAAVGNGSAYALIHIAHCPVRDSLSK